MIRSIAVQQGPLALAAAGVCLVIVAGCGPVARGPSSPAGATPTFAAAEVARAMEFRRAFGLRADTDWVVRMALDPLANNDFGLPLAADEVAFVHGRLSAAKAVLMAVNGYARQFPEYAGGYVDLERGGIAVVSFTGRMEEHRVAINELVAPDAPLAIEQVGQTREELLALKERVLQEADWMRSIGAVLVSVGIKPSLNMVIVEISSANPGAEEAIVAHFDARGAMFVESDGIGVRLMPTGTLVLTARDEHGRPVPDLRVSCGGDLPDTGTGDIGSATDARGEWRAELTATGYDCDLTAGERVVGTGRAVVPPEGTVRIEIAVRRP